MRAHFKGVKWTLNEWGRCGIVMPAGTVSLFCRNRFIDVYCHMFIAAAQDMGRFPRTLYAHAGCERRAACGISLSTSGDQRSLDPSVDSESVVLYSKPYVALHSIIYLLHLPSIFTGMECVIWVT